MSISPTRIYPLPGADKPRSVFVVAPRDLLCDELRMARLEHFLEAEFPDLNFVVVDKNRGAPSEPSVGVLPDKDGKPQFTDDEARSVIAKVLDATHLFIDYGARLH